MNPAAVPAVLALLLACFAVVQALRTHGVLSGLWFTVSIASSAAAMWLLLVAW